MANCLTTLSILLVFQSLGWSQAERQTVWQIGSFDQSPLEFSSKPQNEITFEVGKSDPHTQWSSFQGIGHPYRILFSLDSPSGLYVLRLRALIVQPRIPVLELNINGHKGMFFLHPALSYFPGDVESSYHPNNSQADVVVEIPPGFLKTGQNLISLTCVEDPPSPKGAEDSSGIAYDAVAFEHEPAGSYQRDKITADVRPTVFYQQSGNGYSEIVDAFVRFNGPPPDGVAELRMHDGRYQATFSGGEDFGERRVSFQVPEWTGAATGQLDVSAGGQRNFAITIQPERKWNLFVVPHTHLDIGFTDYQGKVAETQSRVLSQAADLIRQHPDFRFSMDGSWNLEQLLETRSAKKREEILNLIRSGKMAMPAQYCNLLSGYASLETLYRSLYNSKAFSRKYGLPFVYANITDVPTYSGSYPSVLASSGVKYWVAAANNYRAPLFFHEHWNEVQTLFGLPPELAAVRESLPIFLQAYSKSSYKPDVALIYGTQVENTDLFPSTAIFATDWNKRFAYPKLTYATFPDFFRYVEQHYGKDLPTYKGDGGPYWEDGIGSDAYFAAEDRRNQNRALSAETLSTVMHTVDDNLNPPAGSLTDIWHNIILFAEHTWLSYNAITQPDQEESVKQIRVKDDRAERASLEIEDLMNRSLSQLADQIHVPSNTLVVFNSLNWRRNALVETDLFENPKLTDLTTGRDVPLRVLYAKEKFLHVRFLAEDLPSVGYKCFRIEYGQQNLAQPPAPMEPTVENAFYKITMAAASGSIASIYDKQLQRELVDVKSPYKFGQYLYVTGGDRDTESGDWQTVLAYGGTRIIKSLLTLPKADLTVHTSGEGKFLRTEHQPWGTSIWLTSSAVNTPVIETEILLFDQEKKIEFRYRIHKNYTTAKEGVYLAFPVALAEPAFAYASQQGWLDPARDLMKGGSLEWFSIPYWMATYDSDISVGIVPLDAPLASFGNINRGKWNEEFQPAAGTLFSYIMNNYWDTNYRAGQGGDFVFRYAMTSAAKLDGGSLTHLAMEEMRPPEVDYVVSQDKAGNPPRPLPAAGEGFFETDGAGVSLITWKRAEGGNGTILRLAETTGKPILATIRFSHSRVVSANITSGVEDDEQKLSPEANAIRLSFKPFQVLTVRVLADAKD